MRPGDPLLVLAPVLGAPILHAPILRWDLLSRLAVPLDLGFELGSSPLLGANKTVRGVLAMTGGCIAATLVLSRLPAYWDRLPERLTELGPWRLGLRIGLGTSLGELPNSFLKRRLGVPSGSSSRGRAKLLLMAIDQADFLPSVWASLQPRWRLSARDSARCLIVVVLIHLALNLIGWAGGMRDRPI
jgi:hypothetical protein